VPVLLVKLHESMRTTIAHATTAAAIARCHPVMFELRPHLSAAQFASQVQRQRASGYHLAFLKAGGHIRALAGYRYLETLAWGRICYVDDLVTAESSRSHGFGEQLFEWLAARARKAGCDQFHLDSGVQRFGAHRFYLRQRMEITSHHFALKLKERATTPSRVRKD
jgi:GNAT superfamily N-acetyltransferase